MNDSPPHDDRRNLADAPLTRAEAESRVIRLEALYALADGLHRSASRDDVYAAALRAIRSALRCDRAAVVLRDEAGQMRFAASEGLSAGYRDTTERHSPWDPEAPDPQPIAVSDPAASGLPERVVAALHREGIRSLAFFPLVSSGRLIGKFVAYSDAPRTFADDELQVGLAIARHLTFALDRLAAEQALRDSEARYRALVENQTEVICRFRRDGTILFVNTAYARTRGTTPEALQGANLWDFIPEEERARVRATLDSLQVDHPEARIENRFESQDGPRWILWTNRALAFDEQGNWTEAQATGTDITERRLAEEKVRRTHETFFNLIQNAPFGVYVIDSQFRLIEVSAGSQKVFEIVRPLLGRDFAEVLRIVWDEPFATRAVELFQHTLRTGEPFHAPDATHRRAGSQILETYDWQIERIALPDGQYGVVCYFYDMTWRRQAEEALRLSEERYRSIVSIITDVPWIADAEGRFVTPQPAWARYTGQRWEEHRDFGWVDALHPDDRERLFSEWLKGSASPARFESRGRFWHAASGTWRHFVVKAAPRLNPDGTVAEWVGSCTDEEEAMRSARELQKARDEAVAANRAKDEFLAALSHELRTPLNPVLLIATDGAEDMNLPESVRHDFKLIADNIGLEARLIDDLLDLNRIARGKVTLQLRGLDVHTVLRDALATVADDIAAREIVLTTALTARNARVEGDPVRLRQVFWNVLKNAIKFTPAGGTIHVATANEPGDAEIVIRIQDTGVGMSPDELQRVLEPFVQGSHATRTGGSLFGGLGLGLAISRALVEAHGGRISLESPGPNHGATISIRLACSQVSPADSPVSAFAPGRGPAAASEGPTGTARMNILFVEDHEPTRETLCGLLERRGHEVTTATSLAQAREAARDRAFDLLISDLGLPDGDGCTLMAELRARLPGLGGIALSGYGMDTDHARSAAAGFSCHLTKPVDIHALEAAITRVAPHAGS